MTEDEKIIKVQQIMLMAMRAIRLRDDMFTELKEKLNDFIFKTIGFDREDKIIYESLLRKVNDGTDSLDVEKFDLDASERLLDLMERKLKRYQEREDLDE